MRETINTEGIVLHSFKYNDTSIIARIYTKEKGLQSYLIPGVRKKRASIKNSLFQPLSIFKIVAYHNDKNNLQRIKEVNSIHLYKTLHSDIIKTSMAVFISEMLIKCIKEQEQNEDMFEFLKKSFLFLDQRDKKFADFHLVFLMHLTKYLGFYPNLKQNIKTPLLFNLKEGTYIKNSNNSSYILDEYFSEFFSKICQIKYDDLDQLSLTFNQRKAVLNKIIDYYKIHISGFSNIKSLPVLETVFS